jgi:hypothetical protein
MQIERGVAAFISAMVLSMSSFAATVLPEGGIVLVNHGNGYENVTEPTTVQPGDIVVVNPGGSAQIAYPDGCTVPVTIGAIVTVGAQSPCATQGSMTPTQATIPPPQGGTPPPDGDVTPPGDATPDGTGIGELAINLTIAGAAVGALVLSQQDDKPASP